MHKPVDTIVIDAANVTLRLGRGDAAVDIIRSLRLMSMTILADEHGGSEPFAVLEYVLDTGADLSALAVTAAPAPGGEVPTAAGADNGNAGHRDSP